MKLRDCWSTVFYSHPLNFNLGVWIAIPSYLLLSIVMENQLLTSLQPETTPWIFRWKLISLLTAYRFKTLCWKEVMFFLKYLIMLIRLDTSTMRSHKKFLVRRSEVNRVTRASSHRHCWKKKHNQSWHKNLWNKR